MTPPRSHLAALDPRAKLLMMAVCSGYCMATESLPFLLALLCAAVAALAVGGANLPRYFARCKALFSIIAVLFVIQAVFAFRGAPGASVILTLGGFPLVYAQGLALAAVLALRLLVIVTSAQILLEGEIRDYLLALAQMRVPYELAFMVAIGFHFLPILREEAISVYQCMQLRGVAFKKTSLSKKLRAYAGICLPIFVSTLRRADETSAAMEMRGFRAMPRRTYLRKLTLRPGDVCMMILWMAGVTALFVFLRTL